MIKPTLHRDHYTPTWVKFREENGGFAQRMIVNYNYTALVGCDRGPTPSRKQVTTRARRRK
jgi:hypothetical protein